MKLCVLLVLLVVACGRSEEPQPAPTPPAPKPPEPAAIVLPPAPPLPERPIPFDQLEMKIPEDNPLTAEKVELGKLLFFDKRLSKDGSASCETCHLHDKGWTDGLALSTKVGGEVNKRHTPTLYNVGYQQSWYWDGRAKTLEDQVLAAWKGQMGADPDTVAKALAGIPEYKAHFQRAFSSDPTGDTIVKALASFVRTLISGGSPWDRWERTRDKSAVSADAIAGYKVLTERAGCAQCHTPPLYTNLNFHNVGIGYGDDPKAPPADVGRGKFDPSLTGAFKTPTLRSITRSGPYFHDGSGATLEEAVRFMAKGGKRNTHIARDLHDAKLSDREIAQVIEYLKSLESTEIFEKPTRLPGQPE